MDKKHNNAQMRLTKPGTEHGEPGKIFWTTAELARQLIAAGTAELVNAVEGRPLAPGILRRSDDWPFDRLSFVEPLWREHAVVVIGGGPSLAQRDLALVQIARERDVCRVIAVNDAYLWAPWADILYAADSAWWAWSAAGTEKPLIGINRAQARERFESFAGQRCSIQHTGTNVLDPSVHLIRNVAGAGRMSNQLSRDPGALGTGWHSGFQAVNLAVLSGSTKHILLGFDGAPSTGGRTHFHGGHQRVTPASAYEEYRRSWREAESQLEAAGVTVWNASPGTYIDTFLKVGLADALASLARMS